MWHNHKGKKANPFGFWFSTILQKLSQNSCKVKLHQLLETDTIDNGVHVGKFHFSVFHSWNLTDRATVWIQRSKHEVSTFSFSLIEHFYNGLQE